MIDKPPTHPGEYVRRDLLEPKKLTVTAAAKLLGVSRPALSNLLNGNVGATPEMAARIERAFGTVAQKLLDMQTAYDAATSKAKGVSKSNRYAPPFLSIKANDIEVWSTQILARSRLAVLIRTLINSTGVDLKKVDFPGNDDAERHGCDGYVDAGAATPWVPLGLSGWEFGTNANVKSKADSDFAKSVAAAPPEERAHLTFVFVTPRRWSGKAEWIKENKAKAAWRDVRAYDSSDLEQWLEQSIAGQAWFANETNLPSHGVRSLDQCWSNWANVSDPPLVGALFAPAIESAKRTVLSRLTSPPGEPTVIAADSTEEALAFLSQLFSDAGGKDLEAFRDRVLVFDKQGALSRLAQGAADIVVVATTREVERELGPFAARLHSIVVYPHNATAADRHVVLEPLNHEAFRSALEAMELSRDEIARLADESGRSLTVLRRRRSNVPAIRIPEWAAEHTTAQSLIPFLFVGAWNSKNTTDQTALQLLAEAASYDELEKQCQHLAQLNDPPLWSVGTFRGVVSKTDLLFAIAGKITVHDLRRYFSLAKIVLGEDDPRLDLPEDKRWAASLYGKAREFSGVLRQGISETLVLLALYGKQLFSARLGFDCEIEAATLVRELLTPLKTRLLEANEGDLPLYAEAAPDEFLSILEDDLRSGSPETCGLMRPAGSGVFGGGCARSGLLWALEGLAWSPRTLPRAVLILAQLAEIEIDDNWVNKPINSLLSIFRVWMPQTAANHEERLAVIKLLAEQFPRVAWKVCLAQLSIGHETGDYNHKPRWRPDGHGFGEPLPTWAPILAFKGDMIEMALSREGYSADMICDLIERLPGFDEACRMRAWNVVNSWASSGVPDAEKALVREKIRVTVMSRRAARQSRKANLAKLAPAAKAAYKALEPSDVVSKHEWLFRQAWVDESADEIEDDDLDYSKREERIATLRAQALREVVAHRGLDGVIELAEMGKAASQIGWAIATDVLDEREVRAFLLKALQPNSGTHSAARKNLIFGALRSIGDEGKRTRILVAASKELETADLVRLLLLAPFRKATWNIVDALDEPHRQSYWKEILPDWIHDSDDELNEAIERLLAARRPRAAFSCAHLSLEKLKPKLLHRTMKEMAEGGEDQAGQHQLEQYSVEKAFVLLDADPSLTLEQKAKLELAYIDALSRPWRGEGRGIPNLEKYVDAHPELFVQAIVWTYKRRDDDSDPPNWQVPTDKVQHFAELGHKLLEALERLPGHDRSGELKLDVLSKWMNTVRQACAELGRADAGDNCLGKLLSQTSEGNDGVWPCEVVRQVMEDVHSKKLMSGAHSGRYNARGVVWRGEGGAQERELADQYFQWARALQFSHPFVSSELLMKLGKTYEYEAEHEDARAGIRRRLR